MTRFNLLAIEESWKKDGTFAQLLGDQTMPGMTKEQLQKAGGAALGKLPLRHPPLPWTLASCEPDSKQIGILLVGARRSGSDFSVLLLQLFCKVF